MNPNVSPVSLSLSQVCALDEVIISAPCRYQCPKLFSQQCPQCTSGISCQICPACEWEKLFIRSREGNILSFLHPFSPRSLDYIIRMQTQHTYTPSARIIRATWKEKSHEKKNHMQFKVWKLNKMGQTGNLWCGNRAILCLLALVYIETNWRWLNVKIFIWK